MLVDNIDDLKVEGLFLLWLFLTESVSFLISIGDFVVEVYFFSEFGEILISYIFINLVSHVIFDMIDFNLSFNFINLTILIKVVLKFETFGKIVLVLRLHHKLGVVFVVDIIS